MPGVTENADGPDDHSQNNYYRRDYVNPVLPSQQVQSLFRNFDFDIFRDIQGNGFDSIFDMRYNANRITTKKHFLLFRL